MKNPVICDYIIRNGEFRDAIFDLKKTSVNVKEVFEKAKITLPKNIAVILDKIRS
jgi:hypothetical protein